MLTVPPGGGEWLLYSQHCNWGGGTTSLPHRLHFPQLWRESDTHSLLDEHKFLKIAIPKCRISIGQVHRVFIACFRVSGKNMPECAESDFTRFPTVIRCRFVRQRYGIITLQPGAENDASITYHIFKCSFWWCGRAALLAGFFFVKKCPVCNAKRTSHSHSKCPCGKVAPPQWDFCYELEYMWGAHTHTRS